MEAALASVAQKITKPKGLPKGFLSIGELAKKYPEMFDEYHNEYNRDRPLKVWIDEDDPVYAEMAVKVERVFSEEELKARREVKRVMPFKMAEDRYECKIFTLPVREPFEMSVANYIYLWGDPSFRFDLEKKPQEGPDYATKCADARWMDLRMKLLDRFRRNPTAQETKRILSNGVDEILPPKYSSGTYNPKNTEKGLWNKMPPVYVLPPEAYEYVVKDDKTQEDHVFDVLNELKLKVDKPNYTDKEIDSVKGMLASKGLVSEIASITTIRSMIKDAQVKNGIDINKDKEA